MKQLIRALVPQSIKRMYRAYRIKRETPEQRAEDERRLPFYRTFIEPGDICFDVGANVGNRIRPLLKIGAKVVAVEPQDSCIEILRIKFGNQIELVTKGLAAVEGEMEFYISDSSTISSFSKDWIDAVKKTRFKQYNWNTVKKVQMTTLEHLISTYGKPKFIKIDVEGFELDVLEGLKQPIAAISIEYTVPEQADKAIACIQRIAKNGGELECNYSIGESMEFALEHWLNVEEMITHIQSPDFLKTKFGDIYIMLKK